MFPVVLLIKSYKAAWEQYQASTEEVPFDTKKPFFIVQQSHARRMWVSNWIFNGVIPFRMARNAAPFLPLGVWITDRLATVKEKVTRHFQLSFFFKRHTH